LRDSLKVEVLWEREEEQERRRKRIETKLILIPSTENINLLFVIQFFKVRMKGREIKLSLPMYPMPNCSRAGAYS